MIWPFLWWPGMCYSASFSDRFWPWRSFGPTTCHAGRTLNVHPRTTPQHAPSRGWPMCAFEVRRFNAWVSNLLYLVLYFADSTFALTRLPRPPSSTSRSPPRHHAHFLDIPLTPSTPPRTTSTPTPPVCGCIPWEHYKDLNSEVSWLYYHFVIMDIMPMVELVLLIG